MSSKLAIKSMGVGSNAKMDGWNERAESAKYISFETAPSLHRGEGSARRQHIVNVGGYD